jgi:hypothetical protein
MSALEEQNGSSACRVQRYKCLTHPGRRCLGVPAGEDVIGRTNAGGGYETRVVDVYFYHANPDGTLVAGDELEGMNSCGTRA